MEPDTIAFGAFPRKHLGTQRMYRAAKLITNIWTNVDGLYSGRTIQQPLICFALSSNPSHLMETRRRLESLPMQRPYVELRCSLDLPQGGEERK